METKRINIEEFRPEPVPTSAPPTLAAQTKTAQGEEVPLLWQPLGFQWDMATNFDFYYQSSNGILLSKTNEWDDYLDDESPTKERVGKQNGKTPRDNKKQNKQTDKVAKDLNLKDKEREELHRLVGHMGLGYKEVLELAKEWFNK